MLNDMLIALSLISVTVFGSARKIRLNVTLCIYDPKKITSELCCLSFILYVCYHMQIKKAIVNNCSVK